MQMPRQIPALTGLRGVAALWVALHHYQLAIHSGWGESMPSLPLARYGYFGVDIFFILSGFIIGHVHLEDFRQIRWPALKRFAILRFFRIYPLHWFILACLVAMVLWVPPYHDFVVMAEPERLLPTNFAASFLLCNYWGHDFGHPWNGVAWTLSLEILAYLAFPLLAWAVVRIRSPRLCLGLAICLLLGLGAFMAATHSLDHNLKWRGGLLRVACEFTAGVLLNRFCRQSEQALPRSLGLFALIAIPASLLIPLLSPLRWLSFGALVLGLASNDDRTAGFFRSPMVKWLGEISFSFYLVHEGLYRGYLWWLSFHGVPSSLGWLWAALFAGMLLTILVGWMVNRLIERPARRLGRRLTERSGTGAVAVA